MKVYKKNFKDLFFELGIEGTDDLWALSLLISEDDLVSSKTTRRFRANEGDDSEKKTVFINLEVKNIKLDINNQILKIIGLIESGHPIEYVTVGQHHSFDLTIGDKIGLKKKMLLDFQKKILKKALDEKPKSKIILVVIDDDSCVIARLEESRYSVITEITFKGSGKRDLSNRNQNRENYFESVIKVILNENLDKVIVGGPGFEKEYLQKYIFEKQSKELQNKFIFANASSPGLSGIKELINGGQVKKILTDLNVQKDSDLINEFLLYLAKDKPVTYGLIQIKEALEKNSLKTVLITDNFFHENFNEIKNLLLRLEENNIEYHIVNSDSEPGRILDNMSGISAFLYY